MKQRLGQGPTSSYTNILHGVTVTNRHSAHAHNLICHSPTQTHTTHGDLTRHDHTDCQEVMPTLSDISCPCTIRPGESLQTAANRSLPDTLSHPGSQTSSPTHSDTPPGSWPSHAQLVPGPQDKSWLHPGDSHSQSVAPAEPWPLPHDTPPTCPLRRKETCRVSIFLLRAAPALPPKPTSRGGLALSG